MPHPRQAQADVAARPEPTAASRGSSRHRLPPPAAPNASGTATATASWYDVGSGAGACGKKCATYAPYTFASRTMRFGTAVQFCVDQRCVIARCTDRGPYIDGRTFDLSRTVFAAIAPVGAGTVSVRWAIV